MIVKINDIAPPILSPLLFQLRMIDKKATKSSGRIAKAGSRAITVLNGL